MVDEALKLAIKGIDQGYKMVEVAKKYDILNSFLRNHIKGRTRNRRLEPKIMLIHKKEQKLCDYIDDMVKWEHPVIPKQLKKATKITQ